MILRRAHHRGFTLIEILMSVAILAGLLVATAAAIGASTRAFNGNVASADMLQHGRNAMMRMATELRTGSNHLPTNLGLQVTFASGNTVQDTGVTFTDQTGRQITYAYNSAAKTITLKVGTATPAVLARGVDSFAVRLTPARSKKSVKTGGIYDELARATLTMTLHSVDKYADPTNKLSMTESVTPRVWLWN